MNTEQFDGHTLNDSLEMGEPDYDGAREMLCGGGIVGWLTMADYPSAEADARLIAAAPDLLAEVRRLREVIDKEHPTFDWASRQTIANLEAEVERLRALSVYRELEAEVKRLRLMVRKMRHVLVNRAEWTEFGLDWEIENLGLNDGEWTEDEEE